MASPATLRADDAPQSSVQKTEAEPESAPQPEATDSQKSNKKSRSTIERKQRAVQPAKTPTQPSDKPVHEPKKTPASKPNVHPYQVPELTDAEKTVTQLEASEFAARLTELIAGKSEEPVFSLDRHAQIVAAGLPVENPLQDQFTMSQCEGMLDSLITAIADTVHQNNSHYMLQQIYEKDGRRWVRFRLLLADGALNYHEYRLINQDGNILAEDLRVALIGEFQSKLTHDLLAGLLAQKNRGLIAIAAGRNAKEFDRAVHRNQMLTLFQSNPAEALKLFETLTPEEQGDPISLRTRVMAMVASDNESEFNEALDNLLKAAPDDPLIHLLSVDPLSHFNRHEEALSALNRLESYVGGDPAIGLTRSRVYSAMGDREAALEGISVAIQAFQGEIIPHFIALSLYIDLKAHPEMLQLLIAMDETFDLQWNDLRQNEHYAEFVKSPQFKEWQTYLAKVGKVPAQNRPLETF
ncbi:hypothetical protein SH668x_001988 [Planctomicrobium sp. SH668]|uniref:hypothetical protein n=1 Tax=Planctomicrobium sp. SH668 TaxID=3448126 RepID=UPI003F5C6921